MKDSPTRKIIHIDMDAYYASVEQRDDPGLRGKPVAVGGDPARRGVVMAASYEARAFGVRSAMPMSRAVRLCPSLEIVRPRMKHYAEISRKIRSILEKRTRRVESISLDEAYLDVSDQDRPATQIAAALKAEILAETGLTASAGVGPSKMVAKIASDMRKPDGLVVIKPEQVKRFLAPLPVERMWGVGPVTRRKLETIGVRTIGDLSQANREVLRRKLGSHGPALMAMALGRDDREVSDRRKSRSMSCERTFDEDTDDLGRVVDLLESFAGDLELSLARHRLVARTVVLKLRFSDFRSITRSRTRRTPFRAAPDILAEGRCLLGRATAEKRRIRLVGLGVSQLIDVTEPFQPSLFSS